MASYEHAHDLVRIHGESGWTARLVPLTVDGLIYASSMVMLDSARRRTPDPALARWLLGLGVAATLAANVAHGLGRGPIGAAVAAWPAVALVGSYELLMMVIPGSQQTAGDVSSETEQAAAAVPRALLAQAAEEFSSDVGGRPPTIDPSYTRKTPRGPIARLPGARVARHACGRLGQSRGRASVPGK